MTLKMSFQFWNEYFRCNKFDFFADEILKWVDLELNFLLVDIFIFIDALTELNRRSILEKWLGTLKKSWVGNFGRKFLQEKDEHEEKPKLRLETLEQLNVLRGTNWINLH